MTESMQPSPPLEERSSLKAVLIFFTILLMLAGGIAWIGFKIFRGDTPAIKVETPAMTPVAQATQIVEVAKTEKGINIGVLAVQASPSSLKVQVRGKTLLDLGLPEDPKQQWVAGLRNPYAPLQLNAGSPFMENTKSKLPIGDNLQSLIGEDGKFRAFSERDFGLFSFFTAAPTTIGFVVASNKGSEALRGLTMFFIDSVTGVMTSVRSPIIEFPEWLRDKGTPPPFSTRGLLLAESGDQSAGDFVITSSQRFDPSTGRYVEDAALRLEVAAAEFKKTLLSQDELAALKKADLSKGLVFSPAIDAVRKLVRLVWYGKLLGRDAALRGLLDQLHPSVAKAIRANPKLAPK